MSFPGDFVTWFAAYLAPYTHIPQSTLFTIGIALALSFISSAVSKLLVDYDTIWRNMSDVHTWQKDVTAARKANDKVALEKLMRKNAVMMKLQSKASLEQFKVTAVTFVPFVILWYLLNSVFGGLVVAVSPFPLPFLGVNLTFVTWYFLSSFAISFPMMRLFRIGMNKD